MSDASGLPWRARGRSVQLHDPMIVLRPEQIELGDEVRIDGFVKLEGGLGIQIGAGVHVASFAHIGIGGGQVIIGDYAGIASRVAILSGTAKPEGLSMSASAPAEMLVVKRYTTRIGRYALIGTGAVVMPGVEIGAGAVVGAGSVVMRNVPEAEIWLGVPAVYKGQRWQQPDRQGWELVEELDALGLPWYRVTDGVRSTGDYASPVDAVEAWHAKS